MREEIAVSVHQIGRELLLDRDEGEDLSRITAFDGLVNKANEGAGMVVCSSSRAARGCRRARVYQ